MHLVEVGRVFVSSTKYAVLNALIMHLSWKPTTRYNQKWGRTKRTRIRAKRLRENSSQTDEDEHVGISGVMSARLEEMNTKLDQVLTACGEIALLKDEIRKLRDEVKNLLRQK